MPSPFLLNYFSVLRIQKKPCVKLHVLNQKKKILAVFIPLKEAYLKLVMLMATCKYMQLLNSLSLI